MNNFLRLMCVLLLTWTNVSCGESEKANPATLENSPQPAMEKAKPDTPTKNQAQKKPLEVKEPQDFETFYTQFTTAVDKNNWQQVVEKTHFPFVFRGQLDLEGEKEVSKEDFLKIFPKFLELEAFIVLDGEAIPTTYRGLLMTRMDESESIMDEEANIHDFVFKLVDGQWYLDSVFVDLNILEEIME